VYYHYLICLNGEHGENWGFEPQLLTIIVFRCRGSIVLFDSGRHGTVVYPIRWSVVCWPVVLSNRMVCVCVYLTTVRLISSVRDSTTRGCVISQKSADFKSQNTWNRIIRVLCICLSLKICLINWHCIIVPMLEQCAQKYCRWHSFVRQVLIFSLALWSL